MIDKVGLNIIKGSVRFQPFFINHLGVDFLNLLSVHTEEYRKVIKILNQTPWESNKTYGLRNQINKGKDKNYNQSQNKISLN